MEDTVRHKGLIRQLKLTVRIMSSLSFSWALATRRKRTTKWMDHFLFAGTKVFNQA